MFARGRFGTGDFTRPNAFSRRRGAAMAAAGATDGGGFSHVEAAACIYLDAGAA
jgi:hypothetical protein